MEASIIVAIITGSFSLLTFLLTRFFTTKDRKIKNDDEEAKRITELEHRMDKTEKNVDKLAGAVSDMIASQAKHEERTKVLYDSIESTLRNDIVNMYNTYYEDKGYMPIYARENLDKMVKEYYALGGNGVIPSLVDKLYSLDTEKPE